MTEKAKEEVLDIVDQMANLEKKIRELGRQRDEVQAEMQLIRARILLEVAKEKDERGKAVYSNEKLRQAALTVRLAEHNEYQTLRGKQRSLRDQHDDLLIELKRLSERKNVLTADQDRGLLSVLLGLGKR